MSHKNTGAQDLRLFDNFQLLSAKVSSSFFLFFARPRKSRSFELLSAIEIRLRSLLLASFSAAVVCFIQSRLYQAAYEQHYFAVRDSLIHHRVDDLSLLWLNELHCKRRIMQIFRVALTLLDYWSALEKFRVCNLPGKRRKSICALNSMES